MGALTIPKKLNPSAQASPTPANRPPTDKEGLVWPKRSKPETNLKNLNEEQYIKAWQRFLKEHPDDPKAFKKFETIYGSKYKDKLKLKPGKTLKKTPSKNLSTSEDSVLKGRWTREKILNYIFGGETTDIGKEAQAQATRTGKKTTAHHMRGLAEDGPWADLIYKLLNNPQDSKEFKRGMQLLETGNDYFRGSELEVAAGTTKRNISMLDQSRGGVHDISHAEVDAKGISAHRASGMDPVGTFPVTDEFPIKGQTSGGIRTADGKVVPTIEYIQNLPSTREEVFDYSQKKDKFGPQYATGQERTYGRTKKEGVNFFSSWWDHIELTEGERQLTDVKVRDIDPNKQCRPLWAQASGALQNSVSKLREADLLAQMGIGVATGNPIQTTVAGTALAAQQAPVQKRVAKLALKTAQSPQVQKAIAKLLADRAKKTALKTVSTYTAPGLDIGLSGMEAWGYLSQGKLDQAGIATLSGLVGWAGPPGDLLSAILDGSNTALDIARLDLDSLGKSEFDAEGKPKKGQRIKNVMEDVWIPLSRAK